VGRHRIERLDGRRKRDLIETINFPFSILYVYVYAGYINNFVPRASQSKVPSDKSDPLMDRSPRLG
jgi:hypothetical protein